MVFVWRRLRLTPYSAIVMNGITYKSAFSLFPAATFTCRLGILLKDVPQNVVIKYVRRGFDLIRYRYPHHRGLPLCFGQSFRVFADRHSWRLPLPRVEYGPEQPIVTRRARLTCHAFSLRTASSTLSPWAHVFVICAKPYYHPLLDGCYVTDPECVEMLDSVFDHLYQRRGGTSATRWMCRVNGLSGILTRFVSSLLH